MTQAVTAVFLITLGLGQLIATHWQLYAASLVGARRGIGYSVGSGLLVFGAILLPPTFHVLWWTPLAALLALVVLLGGGSFVWPLPPPNLLFTANHPAHGGCRRVDIPDGDGTIPALLLAPPPSADDNGAAVCIVPGAGDSKASYKWLLVEALLSRGLTVLTIDPPGHGDYRHRPMAYPDCLSTIPAAVSFLKAQPEIKKVGLIGISLGGALTLKALAEYGPEQVAALAVIATPSRLNYSRAVFYREAWNTSYGSPVLPVLRRMTIKQARQAWVSGGYRSRHTTAELFDLFQPLKSIEQLPHLPILLVYSRRDSIAPPDHAQAMRQAAPQAAFLESKKASHVMLTLTPEINHNIAGWLKQQLS